MKKILLLTFSLLVAFMLIACGGKNNDTNTDEGTDSSTSTDSSVASDTGTETATDSETSTEQDTTTDTSEESDSDNVETETDTESDTTPPYSVPSVEETLRNELEVFETDNYGNEGNVLGSTKDYDLDLAIVAFNKQHTINAAGKYRVFGKTNSGGIIVNAPGQDVVLLLDNAEITSTLDHPAIYVEKCNSLTIVLKESTVNKLSDSAKNTGEDAVIRVRSCNLTITGKGTLEIVGNSKYGIANTKELTINSGNINITSLSHTIYGKIGVNINGGKLSLVSKGKSGIKSGDADDKDGAVEGYVKINAGSTNITCENNGIVCDGEVIINDGKVSVDAKTGNGIDATKNITINGGLLIFNSYKSSITTDADVIVDGNANLKLITTGNGISANDVTISTKGVVFIKTTPVYENVTVETPADATTYVLENNEYVKYDPDVHAINATRYVRRDCRGIEADGSIAITNGTIGIDSYEDAFNVKNSSDEAVNSFNLNGGRVVLYTLGDAVEAENAIISEASSIEIFGCEKGLKADTVTVNGGRVSIIAEKDTINAVTTVINGGTLYLFEKIDLGETGTVSVKAGTTMLMVCTNSKAQATSGTAKYVSSAISNKESAASGTWLKVTNGETDFVLVQLPKDYTEKMAVYYSSATVGSSVVVELGTISEDGTFVAQTNETIKK